MFTGLVQTQGQLLGRTSRGSGYRLAIRHDFGSLEMGESVAVNGACLTVAAFAANRFEADCSKETVDRTTLGGLPIGTSVHLERALRVGDRLGGHFVSGHVDAVIALASLRAEGDAKELVFALPRTLAPYVAEKGSITIDGVSLTVTSLSSANFGVMVVPHTLASTHLGSLRRGNDVNVEVDVLARYVVHHATHATAAVGGSSELASAATVDRSTEASSDANVDRDAAFRKTLNRAGWI
ncbi:MAG: riboflavin synthase [Polyangiaceae bacterium]